MFCPGCGAEFDPGVETCADCGVALVAELPDDFDPKYQELVTVFDAFNANELAVAESLLQGAEIPYFVQNTASQSVFGVASGTVGRSRIEVKPEFAEAALDLLADLEEGADENDEGEFEEEE